jgi:hypothetical protein
MKVLHIVESAYRATLEEQDDTVLWLVQVLRGAGAEPAVLLQGSAVSYAVVAQEASGLAFGSWRQTRPPDIATSVFALVRDGVVVYGIEEDFADRGIREDHCIGGVRRIPRTQVAALFVSFDQIWQW